MIIKDETIDRKSKVKAFGKRGARQLTSYLLTEKKEVAVALKGSENKGVGHLAKYALTTKYEGTTRTASSLVGGHNILMPLLTNDDLNNSKYISEFSKSMERQIHNFNVNSSKKGKRKSRSLKNEYHHVVVSYSNDDLAKVEGKTLEEKMIILREISLEALRDAIDLDDFAYYFVGHMDFEYDKATDAVKEHDGNPHFHFTISGRDKFGATLNSKAFTMRKYREACTNAEIKYGLKRTRELDATSTLKPDNYVDKQLRKFSGDSSFKTPKEMASEIMLAALNEATNVEDFVSLVNESKRFEILPYVTKNGKLSALKLYDHEAADFMKMSGVGNQFGFGQILKKYGLKKADIVDPLLRWFELNGYSSENEYELKIKQKKEEEERRLSVERELQNNNSKLLNKVNSAVSKALNVYKKNQYLNFYEQKKIDDKVHFKSKKLGNFFKANDSYKFKKTDKLSVRQVFAMLDDASSNNIKDLTINTKLCAESASLFTDAYVAYIVLNPNANITLHYAADVNLKRVEAIVHKHLATSKISDELANVINSKLTVAVSNIDMQAALNDLAIKQDMFKNAKEVKDKQRRVKRLTPFNS